MRRIAEIIRFRSLLTNLVISELKLRYRRSVLDFIWTMLNPLLMMIILSVVFSTIMRFDMDDYAVMLIAGLLPWIFFSQAVNLALGSVVHRGNLLKKVYIPKTIIPLAAVISALINFLLALIPLFLIVLIIGKPLQLPVLVLPASVAFLTLFTIGVAFTFACLNVFFRDFTHMTEVILQALFYLSPVIYRLDMVPENYRSLFLLNPLVYLIEMFRVPIFDGQFPSPNTFAVAGLTSLAVCVVGVTIFVRFERHFILRV